MKSSLIKIENVDHNVPVSYTIRLKPLALLITGFIVGIICFFIGSPFSELGLFLSVLCVFFFAVLPDRVLLQFTNQSVRLYSKDTPGEVRLLYYDEIVSYTYMSSRKEDVLVFRMIDGSTYQIEVFGKYKLMKILEEKLPFKNSEGK